jgi:hypothetical protein
MISSTMVSSINVSPLRHVDEIARAVANQVARGVEFRIVPHGLGIQVNQ